MYGRAICIRHGLHDDRRLHGGLLPIGSRVTLERHLWARMRVERTRERAYSNAVQTNAILCESVQEGHGRERTACL